MSQVLAKLDQAARMLAEVSTVQEATDIADVAHAAHAYAKRAKLGREAQTRAASIRFQAERKAGEFLKEMPLHGGDRKSSYRLGSLKLTDIGLTQKESHRFQLLAKVPEAELTKLIAGLPEVTASAVYGFAKKYGMLDDSGGVGETHASTDLADFPGPYGCFYADPPWSYGNQGTRASTDNHYGTMSVEEIAAFPIEEKAADNAHLHLWTTNAFLFDARTVMEAWGFTYKSCFVWVKPNIGMGNYWRVSHEFLLMGVRGSLPFRDRSLRSWGEFPRGQHSAKPEPIYDLIEKASPGPYFELFARRQRDDWASWGDGVEPNLFFEGVA